MNIWKRRVIIVGFGLSGMAALIYEVVWTRQLVLIFGSTVYAVSLMLTAFMAGLALGSYLTGRCLPRLKNLSLTFAGAELLIGLYGVLFPFLLTWVQYLYVDLFRLLGESFVLFQIAQAVFVLVLMLLPTSLMGATFPLVTEMMVPPPLRGEGTGGGGVQAGAGRTVGFLYAVNTVGAVVGPIASGFLLIPVIGVRNTSLVAAGLNILVALAIVLMEPRIKGRSFLVLFFLLLLSGSGDVFQEPTHLVSAYYLREMGLRTREDVASFLSSHQILFHKEGPHGTVQVVRAGTDFSLHIDGRTDASTHPSDMATQLLSGYLPLLLHPGPHNILIIGLGGGFTTGIFRGMDIDVDMVEIESGVVEAERYFSRYNNSALTNTRLRVILNDARNFLLLTDRRYDLILSEPSHPVTSSVNNLFTKEFFHLVKGHLTEGGLFVPWLPAHRLFEDDYKILVKTLVTEFPSVSIWRSGYKKNGLFQSVNDTVLIASVQPHSLSPSPPPAAGEGRVGDAVAQDIARRLGFEDPADLRQLLVLDQTATPLYVNDVSEVNSDDHPLIEFRVPRSLYSPPELLSILTLF